MAYLKFLDKKDLVRCTVMPGKNIVTLKFPDGTEPVVSTAGFRVFLDDKGDLDIGGDAYLGFTTIYRNDDATALYNGYQLSNDGTVYVPPEPTPEPEPYEPTLEEVKAAKEWEISAESMRISSAGVEYEGHQYPYSDAESMRYRNLLEMAMQTGMTVMAEHDAGREALTGVQIKDLYLSQERNMAYHRSYSKQLIGMVQEMEDKEAVQGVVYGQELDADRAAAVEREVQEDMRVVTAYADQLHYAAAAAVTEIQADLRSINDAMEGKV